MFRIVFKLMLGKLISTCFEASANLLANYGSTTKSETYNYGSVPLKMSPKISVFRNRRCGKLTDALDVSSEALLLVNKVLVYR